jgi:predicted DNA-binding transcriptional regulator YafY
MKIDRLVSIIMILLEKERIGAQELADRFEVSPRTIYRDIDAINMAGIPVCSVPGVGGGFEIMREYKVDKKVFSAADLSAILMGLSSLSNMIRGDELVNALAKEPYRILYRFCGQTATAPRLTAKGCRSVLFIFSSQPRDYQRSGLRIFIRAR